jgi:hypothetical protein
VDRYIPQWWISRSMARLGGGKVVDIRYVYDRHRMSHYLAKYLSKDVILSAPRGVRRWSASWRMNLFQKRKSTGGWQYPFRTFDLLYWFAWRSLVHEEVNRDGQICRFTTTADLLAI